MTKPRKGRRPKCPTGVTTVWRPTAGWRFRAFPRINGKHVAGPWRETKDEAAADVVEIRKRAGQIEDIDELLTFDTAAKLMLAETEAVGCRPATLQQYREKLKPLWRHFRGTPLHDITRQRIENYRDMRTKTPTRIKSCRCSKEGRKNCEHEGRIVVPGAASINKELATLGRLFAIAISKDRLPGENPVRKVRRLKAQKRESPHFPANEVVEILAAIRQHAGRCRTARQLHDLVLTLFCSGMRIGELAHLRVEHVNLRRGVLTVPVQGKTGERVIPLPEGGPLLVVLRRMVEGRPPKDYVLGRPPERTTQDIKSNLFRRWRPKLPQHLQEGFHAHTLRHSFSSHLADEGIHPFHIKQLMGHSDRTVPERYAHATPLQLRRDLEQAFGHLTADLLGGWGPEAIAAAE